MRRMLALLATGTVLMPLAACGSEPGPDAAGQSPSAGSASAASRSTAVPSAASPATGSPATGNAATTTPKPSATATGRPAATSRPTRPPATTAAPPGSDELPGELPHGNRALTGVVERSGDCTMLRVDGRLWGLTGSLVHPLRSGTRVTVRGQITNAAGSCAEAGATRSVVVRSVTES